MKRKNQINVATSNDPKLSDCGGRRGPCAGEGGEGGPQSGGAVKGSVAGRSDAAGSTGHDARSGSLQRMVRRFSELMPQWENRAKQAFLRGDATSESVALTYLGCKAEVMAILGAPEEDASHTPVVAEGSNYPQE
jgi:hypothetical protein